MADRFRTQDAPLTGARSYSVIVPDAPWFWREALDLLRDMTYRENWEQVGAVTVDQAVNAAIALYQSWSPMLGQIISYATSDPPGDYILPCNGAQYEREDYPELYGALDPIFIVDEDHFVVPDLRGRVSIGAGSGAGLTPRVVGDTGGQETHVLTTGEMPSHSHTDSGHMHTTGNSITAVAFTPGELPVLCPNPIPAWTGSASANLSSTGGGAAHENMQPWLALNYGIIAR